MCACGWGGRWGQGGASVGVCGVVSVVVVVVVVCCIVLCCAVVVSCGTCGVVWCGGVVWWCGLVRCGVVWWWCVVRGRLVVTIVLGGDGGLGGIGL